MNEQKRLEALRSYSILDTDEEADYDDLTEIAAAICDSPIALISFVDKDRQWFKSHYGLDVHQTDRCHSFCSHAIQDPEKLMQVEDAQFDQRFQDNPLVTGSPDIRFYAGMPLLDKDGYALGSLCVIDQKPRVLTQIQQKALRTLAHQVIDKLSLRRNNRELYTINQQLTETNSKLREAEESLKKVNTALTESKERLQTILDLVVEGIVITDGEGNITYTNRRNREIFKIDEKKMLTLTNVSPEFNNRRLDGSPLPPEEHPVTMALNKGATTINNELLVSDQYLNSIYLRMNAVPIKDSQENITGAIGSFADITESYFLQEKLKEREMSLRAAISSADLGTWRMDLQTKEFFASARMKELFGFYEDEQISYEDVLGQIAESHRDKVIAVAEASLLQNESSELEYPIVRYHDKKLRWFCATFYAYKDPENPKIYFFAGTTADITERKLEEQRRSDFIGMVSHELRTPLTAIKAYTNLHQRIAEKNDDKMLVNTMGKVYTQVKRMEGMINGFLDVARLGEGKIQLNIARFDIASLFKIAEENSAVIINSHKVLFSPTDITLLDADKEKIEQVLINFINNAVKYSPSGTTIEVSCITVNGMAKVCVKDQGMGIPMADQPYIFERFFRVESEAMRGKKGFGIGLYICKEIIERHQGEIGVESSEGQGSEFWFSLPIFQN
ncbi:ATP-binding protein [Epilithonimonas sp. JDS]|uniref:ATP-binding protein n=1 Tax=Epilithonimonas sp. JDS TaxID=2902797 RepID=UPI001E4904F3|nr:ATP-binding protein [Epilithonimonas sp. JDS]MCD9856749.1 ATP-binding protein [Epilithonimonas sp. JDS]